MYSFVNGNLSARKFDFTWNEHNVFIVDKKLANGGRNVCWEKEMFVAASPRADSPGNRMDHRNVEWYYRLNVAAKGYLEITLKNHKCSKKWQLFIQQWTNMSDTWWKFNGLTDMEFRVNPIMPSASNLITNFYTANVACRNGNQSSFVLPNETYGC